MNRLVVGTIGTVVAGTVSLGLMITPAQAVTLPNLESYDVISSTWKEYTAADFAALPGGLPGGLSALCVVGDSCPTRFWSTTAGRPLVVSVESAARTKTKTDAKLRLADVRRIDKQKFGTLNSPITWSKVKFPKKQRPSVKGVKAWYASVVSDGQIFKMGMAVKGKRIAYFAGMPDYYATKAQFVGPLVRLVKSKSTLPRTSGPAKGFSGTVSRVF